VEILLDGDSVLSGVVLTSDESDEADSLRYEIDIASYTFYLDAAAITPPTSFQNQTIDKIAESLCQYSGIPVLALSDVGKPFESFSVKKDETIGDAIQRGCAKRGLIPYCVGGELILAAAGSQQTTTVLERGKNVVSWGRRSSTYNRYSHYVYHGTSASNDDSWGASARYNTSIEDKGVTHFRPLVVHVETGSGIGVETQAKLEANKRAGSSDQVTVVVNSWFTDEGTAWRSNLLVRVINHVIGVNATMLVSTVRFEFGPEVAQECTLTLVRPETYSTAKFPVQALDGEWTDA
jgi:prophage tail gpP-like protein